MCRKLSRRSRMAALARRRASANSFPSRCAAPREIRDGDPVRVWNDRGECLLVARVSDRVKPGVACALSTWWNKLSPGHRNVNQTVSQALTDMGNGATFYDNLVEIATT